MATLFNAVSIGVLGVAVIGPLAQPENPFYGWGDVSGKFADFDGLLTVPSPFAVIEWKAIFIAIAIHAIAYFILRAQIDE